jgi:hypothetical protein
VVCPNNKILIPFSRLAMQNHLPQALPSPSRQRDERGAGLMLFGVVRQARWFSKSALKSVR